MSMKEKYIMSLVIPAGIILIAGIIGFAVHLITNKDDGFAEEMAEEVIEDQIEIALKLPDGSKRGTVDLTPGSREDDDLGEIAREKIADAQAKANERRARRKKSTEMDE